MTVGLFKVGNFLNIHSGQDIIMVALLPHKLIVSKTSGLLLIISHTFQVAIDFVF